MSKKKQLFNSFPNTVFVVHHDDGDDGPDGSYDVVFDDQIEAAEVASENGSYVATYKLERTNKMRVEKTTVVEYE